MHKFGSDRLSGWTILAVLFFPALQSIPVWASDNDHLNTGIVATEMPIEASGLRVYRDPVSGRIGPVPANIQPPGLSIVEQQSLNRSDHGLRSRSLPNGAVAVDLQGRYRSMAVTTTNTNGKPEVNCTHTPSEANAVLQSAVKNKQVER